MALDQRVDRLERALERLAEAQVRTEERLARLEAVMERLVGEMIVIKRDVAVLKVDVGTLKGDMGTVKKDVGTLKGDMGTVKKDVSTLKGDSLERRYRENAASYFHRILRRIRTLPKEEVGRIADEAEARGLLSPPEREDLTRADVVIQGRLREEDVEAYLLAEVSSAVDPADVQRAAARAQLLHRVAGVPVITAVAGERILPEAEQQAAALAVWRVLDGRAYARGESVPPVEG